MKSCLIIAGEKSGEEHALSFFKELKKRCPETAFYGVGGDDLKNEGVELLYHLKDFSSMGFSEVLEKIPFYFKAFKNILKEVESRQTQTAILIDFQDFNLRLAKKLKKRGVKVLYYVAPQAWAWKAHRAQTLAQSVHTLFTILPFEKEWFYKRGVSQIKNAGHPLMRHYGNLLKDYQPAPLRDDYWDIVLLPGSRKAEVNSMLPHFLNTIDELKKAGVKCRTHLVKVSHLDEKYYFGQERVDQVWKDKDIAAVLSCSHLALAASGTVTLLTGLFQVPTIVCYASSLVNEFIFYQFIKYQGAISLTNLVLNKNIFPELIQYQVNPPLIKRDMLKWIQNPAFYQKTREELGELKFLLQGDEADIAVTMAEVIQS